MKVCFLKLYITYVGRYLTFLAKSLASHRYISSRVLCKERILNVLWQYVVAVGSCGSTHYLGIQVYKQLFLIPFKLYFSAWVTWLYFIVVMNTYNFSLRIIQNTDNQTDPNFIYSICQKINNSTAFWRYLHLIAVIF